VQAITAGGLRAVAAGQAARAELIALDAVVPGFPLP
jgi:hypothetical protein